eukprot:1160238-Pelagomonas_calceolata.AAC.5
MCKQVLMLDQSGQEARAPSSSSSSRGQGGGASGSGAGNRPGRVFTVKRWRLLRRTLKRAREG